MGRSRESPPDLRAARHEIEQIDRALVLLIAARVEAAGTAIRIRSRRDGRVTDPGQELLVLDRARLWAAQAGLPPWLVETVFRAVVRAGKERFESAAGPVAQIDPGVPVPRSRRVPRSPSAVVGVGPSAPTKIP